MEKKDILIIVLILIILSIVSVYGYNYFKEYKQEVYNNGVSAGLNQVSNFIITELNTKGYLTLNFNGTQINLVPYSGEING